MRTYLTSIFYPAPSSKHQRPTSALVVQLTQDGQPPLPTAFEPRCTDKRYATIDHILALDDLYEVLGLQNSPKLDAHTLRRAYLLRSRACHPDKFPEYHEAATLAFKKVSAAYEVLSKPSLRHAYDSRSPDSPPPNLFSTRPADATLNGVLYSVFADFVEGDLETLRTFLHAVDQINPAISFGEDKIEALLQSLSSLRDLLLGCRTYIRVIRFELCRLVEIQHSLRQLSYFDIFGRTRLSLELLRVVVSLPMAIDLALQEEAEAAAASERERAAALKARRSILHPTLGTLLRAVVHVLERSERILS
ncbi:DnaJ-domain-containing protein [Auricularia subglabra TFB-10046 SS5]|nr:DnaJ-domain-containing protein [Auricularia subglabra TFB-10046 SS5]